jgi:hypothetical protein
MSELALFIGTMFFVVLILGGIREFFVMRRIRREAGDWYDEVQRYLRDNPPDPPNPPHDG